MPPTVNRKKQRKMRERAEQRMEKERQQNEKKKNQNHIEVVGKLKEDAEEKGRQIVLGYKTGDSSSDDDGVVYTFGNRGNKASLIL